MCTCVCTHTHTLVQISETVWMEEKRMDYQPSEKKTWATQITEEAVGASASWPPRGACTRSLAFYAAWGREWTASPGTVCASKQRLPPRMDRQQHDLACGEGHTDTGRERYRRSGKGTFQSIPGPRTTQSPREALTVELKDKCVFCLCFAERQERE